MERLRIEPLIDTVTDHHSVDGSGVEMGLREAVLANAIRGRLSNDKRIGDLPISPFVADSNVYLVGYVDTLEQRDIAEFIVRGTPGVRTVNSDELEVRELTQARRAAA